MSLPLWATLAIFPVYLFLRLPFFRLPLHIDTGFYVSNSTIRHRRIRYSQGWNGSFAGGSKVLPELFYSGVYLTHGSSGYKFFFRFYYSLLNFGTAILVGLLASTLGGGSEFLYVAGLAAYSMASSEPGYGVYFESGEQFEVLFQVLALLLVALGIERAEAAWVGAGFGIFMLEALFVKLSSIVGAPILGLGVAAVYPAAAVPMLVGAGGSLALFMLWLATLHRKVRLGPVLRHERYFEPCLGPERIAKRAWRKLLFLGRVALANPIVPVVAAFGSWAAGDRMALMSVSLAAVGATYCFQSARIWYFAIPFLPIWAVTAAFGASCLPAAGCLALAGVWFLLQCRMSCSSQESSNRKVWRLHGEALGEKNAALERSIPELKSVIQGESLFIFGAWNQAYLLLETSWDTPLVSAAPWLDEMAPGWHRSLNETLRKDPPKFLLDTDECLDPTILRRGLGLGYELALELSGFRLYRLETIETPTDLDCRAYRGRA
jgi:hypothetical protein